MSPRYVASIELGGTRDFLKTLNNDVRFQGWNFISSDKNLYGNFEITNYYACGAQTLCAKEEQNPKNHIRGGVGAYLDIKYNPKKTDPKPGQGKIHWIQHIVNNHSIYNEHQVHTDTGTHGLRYDGLDIPISMNVNPYYDTLGTANELSFRDKSYRLDPENPHYWSAELYLVEEIAPQTVKIYNGIRWGWINKIYRKKKEQLPFCPNPDAKAISNQEDCVPRQKIDLGILFDTTGSMGSSINAVQTAAKDILSQLEALGADFRISIADYKDFPEQGGYPYQAVLPFTSDTTAITSAIDSLSGSIYGGGDTPESAYSGLIRTINTEGLGSWREDAKRSVIIMTDAPPHDPEPHTGYTSKNVIDAAYAMGTSRNISDALIEGDYIEPISIYSIISGGDSQAAYYFSDISKQTGGKLYTTNSANDIAKALLDITNDVTDTINDETIYDENPQSVPEPSNVVGLCTMLIAGLGLSRFKHKKQV